MRVQTFFICLATLVLLLTACQAPKTGRAGDTCGTTCALNPSSETVQAQGTGGVTWVLNKNDAGTIASQSQTSILYASMLRVAKYDAVEKCKQNLKNGITAASDRCQARKPECEGEKEGCVCSFPLVQSDPIAYCPMPADSACSVSGTDTPYTGDTSGLITTHLDDPSADKYKVTITCIATGSGTVPCACNGAPKKSTTPVPEEEKSPGTQMPWDDESLPGEEEQFPSEPTSKY